MFSKGFSAKSCFGVLNAIVFAGLTAAAVASSGQQASTEPSFEPTGRSRFRLMHYNVENLFDNQHDAGKNDWEFTPRGEPGKTKHCGDAPPQFRSRCFNSDWTEERLELKVQQIKKVLEKSSRLPDFLSVVEIENSAVAGLLAKVLGYKSFLMTESPDRRGIDVALFYNEKTNLKYLGHQSRRVDLTKSGGRPSRDILAVEFLVGTGKSQQKIVIMVNHWPSQANPTSARWAFAHAVADWSKTYLSKGYEVMVTGDFNVDQVNDVPSPLSALEPNQKGRELLREVDSMVRTEAKRQRKDISYLPPGTYFYVNRRNIDASTWNVLDRFFISGGLLDNVDLSSYRIVNSPEFTKTVKVGGKWGGEVDGVPKDYDHLADTPRDAGFSDHFAIWMDLVF